MPLAQGDEVGGTSRRIDPISRSAKPFCQGELGQWACHGCPWRAIDV